MNPAIASGARGSSGPQPGYGGFSLAGMQLALPMAALREVVPMARLISLPCPAAYVVGGIDLRGVVVPVVDLRRLLGRDAQPAPYPCVIVMVFEGKILGLLAEGVTGVFSSAAEDLHPISASDALSALICGSTHNAGDGSLVSVLSPQALSQLPQVPLADDPEPERQLIQSDATEVVISETTRPVMLMRCGRVPLAIDAMAVHATLSDPKIEPSVLARGLCRGVIDYAGAKVAAIDLLGLCGLGTLDPQARSQAFVMQLEGGRVALLIDEVVDVISTQPEDVISIPRFAVPRPELFAGALPTSVLPAELNERAQIKAQQYFLLNGEALKVDPDLAAMAGTNTPGETSLSVDAQAFAASVGQGSSRRSMITYALGGETATPIEQVSEILPFTSDIVIFQDMGPMLGVMVNRGQSIPVLCLSRLTLNQSVVATPAASVLVVNADGELVGFAVPGLKSIEPADWEPELPAMGTQHDDEFTQATHTRKLALVGSGDTERMLPVLDLLRIARSIQARQSAL
jgi:purine-binding chemotaxis protein CheW